MCGEETAPVPMWGHSGGVPTWVRIVGGWGWDCTCGAVVGGGGTSAAVRHGTVVVVAMCFCGTGVGGEYLCT